MAKESLARAATREQIERDRELYDARIDWLLNRAPSELGETGTLAGTISVLEHGGQLSGVPNTDRYNDYQAGWCIGDSPAEKWRKWAPVWFRLSEETRSILLAHYTPRNDLPPAQRVAVNGELGKLANAALWTTKPEVLGKLIDACVTKDLGGRAGIINGARKRADAAVRASHLEFRLVAEERPEGSPHRLRVDPAGPLETVTPEQWAREYDSRRELTQRVARAASAGSRGVTEEALGEALSEAGRGLEWLSRPWGEPVINEAVEVSEFDFEQLRADLTEVARAYGESIGRPVLVPSIERLNELLSPEGADGSSS